MKLVMFLLLFGVALAEEKKNSADQSEKEYKEFSTDEYLKEGLKDKDHNIEVVQNKLFSKQYGIELFGYYGLNPTNSFESIRSVGGGIGFHFNDYIGIQAMYLDNNNEDSLLNERFKRNYGVAPEYNSEQSVTAYQIQFTPFYAKLAFFNMKLLHYELFVSPTLFDVQTAAGGRRGFGFGVGNRFFLNNWLNVRMEYLSAWYDDEITFQTGSRKGQTVTDRVYSGTILLGISFIIDLF